VQGNIAQKNMQDMLQLKILGHDENLSKIARKKYVRTANLKMPSGKVEIGLDESKSCLYGSGIGSNNETNRHSTFR
jgi:hypothetical protein